MQTGPNIFWTASALRYAAITGDDAWLSNNIGNMRSSMDFLMRRFEPSVGLFLVNGSLMIDTFIRANYTVRGARKMIIPGSTGGTP